MREFWLGYAAALGTYLAIGFCLGCYIVLTNLARFHGGGFQVGRMAKHVGIVALAWPVAILERVEVQQHD